MYVWYVLLNSTYLLTHLLAQSAAESGREFCLCHLFILNDFCQTNYLNIYRTGLHQIYRICRIMAVDERSEVSFSFLVKLS